jgi:2-polyprenyl-3-methyl-5-hydroxy-6-metoxy-1,4-benzoquinol methylase
MPKPEICPLCEKGTDGFPIVGEFVYGGRQEQHFYKCPHCDVAFLFPTVSEEEEAKFYAMEFEKFMQGRAGAQGGWQGPEQHVAANEGNVTRRMKYLQGSLPSKGGTVLEVGCSSGFMLLKLREMGLDVIGIEPSGVFGHYVESCGIPVYASLDEFIAKSEKNNSLDLILHFFLLEHIRHPLQFLDQCLQLLKPGGMMFFEVPSRSDPLITIYDLPAFHRFYWSVAHHWYFNRASLEYLLRQVGCRFELIPEQRYDLSNHLWWALTGKPGGSGKFSGKFTPELDEAYKESMRQTEHCDTYFVRVIKPRGLKQSIAYGEGSGS